MKLSTAVISLASLLPLCSAQGEGNVTKTGPPPRHIVHQFPNGTWIENLVIRPSGQILASVASSPDLYVVNPFTGHTELLATIPNVQGLSGITETTTDLYYIAVGNSSLATHLGEVGTWSLWQIDYNVYNGSGPLISKYMDLPTAKLIDGITTLDSKTILATDINKGNVFRIDLKKKTSEVVIEDPLLLPTKEKPTGVNGIKVVNSTLYFTNSGQSIVGKIPIDWTGKAKANGTILAHVGVDDLTFDAKGNLYTTAGSGNLTELFAPHYNTNRNISTFPGPTSPQFGKTAFDSGCLYVTTTGNDSAYRAPPPIMAGGAIFAVDLFKNNSCPFNQ